jgi:hypothetical protein
LIAAQDIAASPTWLPLESDGVGGLRLVRLDETGYRAASFLDRRILQTGVLEAVCPTAAVAAAAASLAPRANYIFHIGHVGSTLVSRLVGEHQQFFSVREPAVLGAIATSPARALGSLDLRAVLGLLARAWHREQRAVVKATSFVSEIAGPVLETSPDSRALFMFSPALAYLRCILGGPNSRIESRALAPSRLARLRARLGPESRLPEPRSEGEWIAMSWLCEMACLRQAATRFESRIAWVDFDAFLSAPIPAFTALLRALGATPSQDEVERLVSGPIMRRYSKAPEHAYDAALRRLVLESADREHAAEIRCGMQWLAALAGLHPLVDAVLRG